MVIVLLVLGWFTVSAAIGLCLGKAIHFGGCEQ